MVLSKTSMITGAALGMKKLFLFMIFWISTVMNAADSNAEVESKNKAEKTFEQLLEEGYNEARAASLTFEMVLTVQERSKLDALADKAKKKLPKWLDSESYRRDKKNLKIFHDFHSKAAAIIRESKKRVESQPGTSTHQYHLNLVLKNCEELDQFIRHRLNEMPKEDCVLQ